MDSPIRQGRDDLLRIVCHELRGALLPLAGWARLLRRGDLSPAEVARAAEVVDRSVQILARLVADLGALVDSTASDLPLAVAPLDLREVAAATTGLIAEQARRKGVDLRLRAAPEPIWVVGDFVRLTQVVGNLVGNALKFTNRPGQVAVEVLAVRGTARVIVRDSGVGISGEFLPHVFEKFSQEAPRRAGDGSGLGLLVVKRLVERHRGSIDAYSPGHGRGSRFVVTLPLADSVAL